VLMRFEPFRALDRIVEQAESTRRAAMPMDAYRQGDRFTVQFDLPGVDPGEIELTVEQNVLTVRAQRTWRPGEDHEVIAAERPQGTFTRQLFLGDSLDAENIQATYDRGVLTLTIPVAERAKPRKVEVTTGDDQNQTIETRATADSGVAAS
jgi:HSP20 family protein